MDWRDALDRVLGPCLPLLPQRECADPLIPDVAGPPPVPTENPQVRPQAPNGIVARGAGRTVTVPPPTASAALFVDPEPAQSVTVPAPTASFVLTVT